MRRIIFFVLGIFLPLLGGTFAEEKKLSETYGFLGPEIYKLDWGIGNLRVADVNGDGLKDIIVVNNEKAKVEILLQREREELEEEEEELNVVPDDWRFKKEPYLSEKKIYSLDVGDLNGDGRADMAYYGDPKELLVIFGERDGWGDKREFDIDDGSTRRGGLQIGDLNGDGREDLILLGKKVTYIIYQGKGGNLEEPIKYPNVTKDILELRIADLNGDGLKDLLYLAPSDPKPLRFRLQESDGKLGPEIGYRMPAPKAWFVKDFDGDGRDEVFLILKSSGRVKVLKLKEKEGKADEFHLPQIKVYPFEKVSGAKNRDMAIGDLTGDRRLDIIVSDPSSAQLILYRGNKRGGLDKEEAFPSLVGGRTIKVGDLDGDGKNEVLILSTEEDVIGISKYEKGERLSFPKPLKIKGSPKCMDVADLNNDGRSDLAYITKLDSKFYLIVSLQEKKELSISKEVELEQLDVDPRGLKVGDVNQDGRKDLMVFIPYEPMRILLQDGEGEFRDISKSEGYRKGLVQNVTISSLTMGDVDNDKLEEALLASKNFARSLLVRKEDSLEVIDQYNGRSADSEIVGVAAIDLDGDGKNEIVLVDKWAKAISILKMERSELFRLVKDLKIGHFEFKGIFTQDLNRDGRNDLVIFGEEKFGIIHCGLEDLEFEELTSYETEIKKGKYGKVTVGEVNSDGREDVLLTEVNEHFLDILTFNESNCLVHGIKFKVFEEKRYRRDKKGGEEPREAVVADVTNDGRDDIILAVHDRILVYPQE